MRELTSRQFIITAIIIMLASKFVTMPTIIFASANKDAIFSLLFGLLLELLIIFLATVVISRNPDTNLFQLLKKKFHSVGAYIIFFILFCYVLIRLLFTYQELYSFFSELLYDQFSPLFFAIPTFFVTAYLAYKGSRTIGRSFEILLPFIVFGTLLAIVSNLEFMHFDTNLPYFEKGFSPTFYGFLKSSFYFSNSICLLFFVGKVKISNPHFIRNTMITTQVTALITIFICFVFYDVFGMSMQYTLFALSEYSQYDPFILELQRLVWLSAIVDIIKLFCSAVAFTYCIGQSAKPFIRTKATLIPIIIAQLLIFCIATLLNYDLKIMFSFIMNYISYISLGIMIFILLLCLILCVKRRQNDKKPIQ